MRWLDDATTARIASEATATSRPAHQNPKLAEAPGLLSASIGLLAIVFAVAWRSAT